MPMIYQMLMNLMDNASAQNVPDIQLAAQNLVDEYMKIIDGAVTDADIASFEKTAASLGGSGYNVESAQAFISSLRKEYDSVMSIISELQSDSSFSGTDVFEQFQEKVSNGLPESVLRSFNEAVESIKNNPEIEDESQAIHDLMESIVTSEDYSQIEWPVTVTPDLTIDADAETVDGALNTQLNKILSKYTYTNSVGNLVTLELSDI